MKVKDNNLSAEEGMMLTNGEIYAKAVFLADGADASEWREVSKEEIESTEGEEF